MLEYVVEQVHPDGDPIPDILCQRILSCPKTSTQFLVYLRLITPPAVCPKLHRLAFNGKKKNCVMVECKHKEPLLVPEFNVLTGKTKNVDFCLF